MSVSTGPRCVLECLCLWGQPPGLDTLTQNHLLSVCFSGPVPSVQELGECWRNAET